VRVEFLKKLRDEERYVDLDTLSAAIARDVAQAREHFATLREPAPDDAARATLSTAASSAAGERRAQGPSGVFARSATDRIS